MQEELIFHLVRKNQWKENQEKGLFEPESYQEEGYIPCANGNQIEKIANEKFKGITELLLLVIDPTRVNARVEIKQDTKNASASPCIYGPLNTDAIIDKIDLISDDNGNFDIKVESD